MSGTFTQMTNRATGYTVTETDWDNATNNFDFLQEQSVLLEVFYSTTALATGDGKLYFPIPSKLNGYNLKTCLAMVFAKSTSGTPTVQIARGRQANATSAHSFVDMLSTVITIDVNEYSSADATTAYVVNTSNDDVATGDLIRVDVDVAGTGTTGLYVALSFEVV